MKKAILALIVVAMRVFITLQPASAQLQGAGPVDPLNGFPSFYVDTTGLHLAPCLDNGPNCVPDSAYAAPVGPFPTNFPSEVFYWIGAPLFFEDPLGNVLAINFLLEGAFLSEDRAPLAGTQFVFQRKLFRLANLTEGATVTIDHPFGTDVITDGGSHDSNPLPGAIAAVIFSPADFTALDFEGAVTGNLIGPFLVGESPLPPSGFIGICGGSQTVTGGPVRNDITITIAGPEPLTEPLTLHTDQWDICGKLFEREVPDTDGDGVPDDEDQCPNSDLSATVVLDGCDSSAANDLFVDDEVFGKGCTISDLVTECIEDADNRIGALLCTTRLTDNLRRDASLTLRESLGILRCTLRAVFH